MCRRLGNGSAHVPNLDLEKLGGAWRFRLSFDGKMPVKEGFGLF